MTNEELEKAIAFILDQQAKGASELVELQKQQTEQDTRIKNRIEFLLEQQGKHETEIKQLRDNIQALTSVVASLAMQVEADHQIIQNAITSINNNIIEMRDQANQDRAEMRAAVARMETQADKDRQAMASSVDKLVNIIGNVHSRVSYLEDKAS